MSYVSVAVFAAEGSAAQKKEEETFNTDMHVRFVSAFEHAEHASAGAACRTSVVCFVWGRALNPLPCTRTGGNLRASLALQSCFAWCQTSLTLR